MNDLADVSDESLYELLMTSSREAAFIELHTRYSTRIYSYCRKSVGEDLCDDLYQEIFLRLLKAADTKTVVTNFPAYLLRITRNVVLNDKRSRAKVMVALEDVSLVVEGHSTVAVESARMIAQALEILPQQQRDALTMQVYGNFSYEEIAESMDVPLTTVKNWIVRSKKKMRDILSPYVEQH